MFVSRLGYVLARNKDFNFLFNCVFYNKICTSIVASSLCNESTDTLKQNKFIPECETKLIKAVIIGMPNAGKSTLINSLVDRKVCPASNKVHTTRKKSHAIFTEGLTQIVFLDTPGIVSNVELKRFNLEKTFTKDCIKSLNETDVIGVIHDVNNSWTRDRLDIKIIKLLEEYERKPSFLVLNKIDTLKSKRKLLDLTKMLTEGCINSVPFTTGTKEAKKDKIRGWRNFSDVFMVSALNADGIQEIKNYLTQKAKPGNWLYPADQWTDHSPDDVILRTVQATLLDFLPQEIPYKLKTKVELFEITDSGISAVVLVHCPVERIQKLVVGEGNGKLRQIQEKARKDLQCTFDLPIRLQIVVETQK